MTDSGSDSEFNIQLSKPSSHRPSNAEQMHSDVDMQESIESQNEIVNLDSFFNQSSAAVAISSSVLTASSASVSVGIIHVHTAEEEAASPPNRSFDHGKDQGNKKKIAKCQQSQTGMTTRAKTKHYVSKTSKLPINSNVKNLFSASAKSNVLKSKPSIIRSLVASAPKSTQILTEPAPPSPSIQVLAATAAKHVDMQEISQLIDARMQAVIQKEQSERNKLEKDIVEEMDVRFTHIYEQSRTVEDQQSAFSSQIRKQIAEMQSQQEAMGRSLRDELRKQKDMQTQQQENQKRQQEEQTKQHMQVMAALQKLSNSTSEKVNEQAEKIERAVNTLEQKVEAKLHTINEQIEQLQEASRTSSRASTSSYRSNSPPNSPIANVQENRAAEQPRFVMPINATQGASILLPSHANVSVPVAMREQYGLRFENTARPPPILPRTTRPSVAHTLRSTHQQSNQEVQEESRPIVEFGPGVPRRPGHQNWLAPAAAVERASEIQRLLQGETVTSFDDATWNDEVIVQQPAIENKVKNSKSFAATVVSSAPMQFTIEQMQQAVKDAVNETLKTKTDQRPSELPAHQPEIIDLDSPPTGLVEQQRQMWASLQVSGLASGLIVPPLSQPRATMFSSVRSTQELLVPVSCTVSNLMTTTAPILSCGAAVMAPSVVATSTVAKVILPAIVSTTNSSLEVERPVKSICASSVASTSRGCDVRIPTFKGGPDVEYFISQVRLAAEASKWDEATKVAQLATHLEDRARRMLPIDFKKTVSFEELCNKLRSVFASEAKPGYWANVLGSLQRKDGEGIHELKQRVLEIVERAYEDVPSLQAEILATEWFISALTDPDQRMWVRAASPRMVTEAAERALSWENSRKIEDRKTNKFPSHHKHVRAISIPESATECSEGEESPRRRSSVRKMGKTYRQRQRNRSSSRESNKYVAAVSSSPKDHEKPFTNTEMQTVLEAVKGLTDQMFVVTDEVKKMKIDMKQKEVAPRERRNSWDSDRTRRGTYSQTNSNRLLPARRDSSKERNDSDREVRFRDGLPKCWKCDKHGHISRNCRSSGTYDNRRQNSAQEASYEGQEWRRSNNVGNERSRNPAGRDAGWDRE